MRSIDGIPGEECANVLLQIIFWPVLKTLLKLGYFISNLYLAIQSNERQNEWFVEFIPIILILRPAVHGVCFGLQVVGRGYGIFRACLHGGGRPQVGEVTRVGGVTRLSTWSLILIWSRLHDRWGDPQPVTSPTRGPPPPCKQALRLVPRPNRFIFRSFFPEKWKLRFAYEPSVFVFAKPTHTKRRASLWLFDKPTKFLYSCCCFSFIRA